MPRSLHLRERHIGDAERAAYRAALPVRAARAAAVHAHFWVFEHAATPGRFMEFTEAGSDADLVQLVGDEAVGDCWRELQGD